METDCQPTAGSSAASCAGAGVVTCPAERSSAILGDVEIASFEAVPVPASCARPPRRGRLGLRTSCIFMLLALAAATAVAQTSGTTVRHHKVAVEDPSSPPELIQAESAIEKQDYTTAEPLLKKVVAAD